MFKYVLVPATGSDTDASVFSAALTVVRQSNGHLTFLHMRADVQQTLLATLSMDVCGGGVAYDQILQSLEQEVTARQRKAELAIHSFCERAALSISNDCSINHATAELRTETGDGSMCFAEHGRTADLLVVGRSRYGETIDMGMLQACLMTSGRPMLISPPKAPTSLSGTVAIAWKNRPEAAKAVAAASSFVDRADRVIILSVDEGAATDEQSCDKLRYALSWRNPNTTVQRLQQDGRPPVEILLAAAGAANADLLAMGGYGHSRLREVIFGGFTRHVLSGADLPILMVH